jgi:hypothetical protein
MLVRVAEAADTRIRSIRTRCQQRGVELQMERAFAETEATSERAERLAKPK